MRSIIQKLKLATTLALFIGIFVAPVITVGTASAAACTENQLAKPTDTTAATDCAATNGNCTTLDQCDLIKNYINPFIYLLSGLVGVAVVASIIIGGIEYSSSAGDPSKVSAAKNRVRNAIIALITYIALVGILNFLIPGGLLA